MMDYTDFLKSKIAIAPDTGFDVEDSEMTPGLKPHVRDSVKWMVKGGNRALFSSFGLHKTVTQIEACRIIVKRIGGKALIVCPLQIDIVERVINRFSNPGDVVLDPFAGLFTVPNVAIKMGRKGLGFELNAESFKDGVAYLKGVESQINAPTLFDMLEEEAPAI